VIAVCIHSDTGFVHPDVPSVLLESFERLTRKPSYWPPICLYLSMQFASARILNRGDPI
jgi:hypothetical protein